MFQATCPIGRVKREKGFASGLIVPGDLPNEKNNTKRVSRVVKLFQTTCPMKNKTRNLFFDKYKEKGLIVMGDLPK